jgi:hypothetical protein
MRRTAVIITILAVLGGPGGCSNFAKQVTADTSSLADRCGHIMQSAMPFADLDIGDKTSRSPDIRTIIATVQATRTDAPLGSPVDRDLAAECTFTDSILTAFHWTKGGPRPGP